MLWITAVSLPGCHWLAPSSFRNLIFRTTNSTASSPLESSTRPSEQILSAFGTDFNTIGDIFPGSISTVPSVSPHPQHCLPNKQSSAGNNHDQSNDTQLKSFCLNIFSSNIFQIYNSRKKASCTVKQLQLAAIFIRPYSFVSPGFPEFTKILNSLIL